MRAPFTPFGAARNAMEVMDSKESMPVDGASPDRYIREEPNREILVGKSILRDHPRYFSGDMNPIANKRRGLVSVGMGWPLLKKHKTKRSAMSGGGFHVTQDSAVPVVEETPGQAVCDLGRQKVSLQENLTRIAAGLINRPLPICGHKDPFDERPINEGRARLP